MRDVVIRGPLRHCLQALVLLNLAFVQISGGVAAYWMLPMLALTLASPLLARCQDRLLYRVLWNSAVLGIFVVLVNDASRAGVRFLLEDGLILAAFCQVHLLNNLGRQQKPDLLFFNSFLIALVTSFFCQDLTFALVFGVYAFVTTVGLQVACAGQASWSRALLRDGGRRAGLALVTTIAVFLVWPRDFNREGLVGETLRGSSMEVGFSEQVELGRSGQTVMSSRVVMRVRCEAGQPGDVPGHWRGATFVWYERGRWLPDDRPQGYGAIAALDETWVHPRPQRWLRPGHEARATVSVELLDRSARRLFAPLEAHQIDLLGATAGLYLLPRADGSLKSVQTLEPDGDATPLTYRVGLSVSQPRAAGGVEAEPMVPPLLMSRGLPPAGRELARRLAAGCPEGAPQSAVVEAIRSHLARTFAYLVPGAQGAARDLDDFLSGGAGGHCEYFATALALMLRSEGIPCRLATGYLCTEWDEQQHVLTVRSKHAHAWVEVWDGAAGHWYAVDASPTGDAAAVEVLSWWARFTGGVTAVWDAVTAFDGEARTAAMAALRALPGRILAWAMARPLAATAWSAGVLGAWWGLWRWRRRRREPVAVHDLRLAMARAGLSLKPGETPRELLRRARGRDIAPARLTALERAARRHERARYAGETVVQG